MKNKIRIYYILSILYGISLTIFGAISYVFLEKSGFTYQQIGIYLSMFWIISMIFEIPTGIIVDVFKHKKTLILANIIRMIGIYFLAFNYGKVYLILISAFLTGFAEAVTSGNLSSWIVNEINQSKEDIKLNVLFSKLNTISTIFGLISGYIGSEYLYSYNIKMPFIVSILIFLTMTVIILLYFDDKSEKFSKILKEKGKIKEQYKNVISQIKFMIFKKELYYFLGFFMILDLINLGPSEQWQAVYKENIFKLSLGIIWILIGISGIIGNFIPSKLNIEKVSSKKIILLLLLIDLIIVFIQSTSVIYLPLFFVHIIIFSVLGILFSTYMHTKIIKDDDVRATAISVINTFDSLIMTVLLYVNGYLSTKLSIFTTWKIFLIISIFVMIVLFIKMFKNKND